jgi:hypothetical protein
VISVFVVASPPENTILGSFVVDPILGVIVIFLYEFAMFMILFGNYNVI